MAERARQQRDRVDLRLVDDVHARMERVEEDRRIDVALMVRAVDGGAVERNVLRAGDADLDAAQREAQAHAAVAEDVEDALPAEDHRQQHADRGGEEHVEGDGDVGGDGPDGGDDQRGAIINEKARRIFRPGGLLMNLTTVDWNVPSLRRARSAPRRAAPPTARGAALTTLARRRGASAPWS